MSTPLEVKSFEFANTFGQNLYAPVWEVFLFGNPPSGQPAEGGVNTHDSAVEMCFLSPPRRSSRHVDTRRARMLIKNANEDGFTARWRRRPGQSGNPTLSAANLPYPRLAL